MSIDQDKCDQVDFYLNFFPKDLGNYVEKNNEIIKKIFENITFFKNISNMQQIELDIIILGVGAGYFEIPLIYWIFKNYPNLSINITAIDKSEKYKEIFLKAIEKIYNEKDGNTFGRKKYQELNKNCKYCTEKKEKYNSKNGKIKVEFIVTDIEKDYKINEKYDANKQLFSKKYDIAICSFIFNHISFWRSLIIDIRNALKNNGSIFIPQIGGDSLLLNGDINKWKYESSANKTNNKNKEELIDFFSQFYPINFSILSDNHEISAINISLAIDFCEKVGFIKKSNLELKLDSFSTSKEKLLNAIENNLYSCFTENIKFHKEYNGKDIIKNLFLDKKDKDIEFNFDAKVKWYLFNKKNDNKIYSEIFGVNQNNIRAHLELFNEQIQSLKSQRIPIFETIPENFDNLKTYMSYRLHLVSNIFRRYRILLDTVKVANLTFNNPFFDFDKNKFYNGNTLFFANNELSKEKRKKFVGDAKKYFEKLQKAKIDGFIKANFTNLNFFYNNLSNIISSNFIIKFDINKQNSSNLKLYLEENISQIVLNYNPNNELDENNISEFIRNTIGSNEINKYLPSINKSMEITNEIFGEGFIYFFPVIIHVAKEMEKQFITLTIITNKELQDGEIIFYNKIIIKLGDITNYNNVLKFYHFKSKILKQQLKTAIISILVDSFAHNIAAHSLQQILKWLNKRVQYSNQKFNNEELSKCSKLKKAIKEDKIKDFTNFKKDEFNISSVLWDGNTDCINQLIENIKNIRDNNSELREITDQYLPLSFDVFRYNFLKYINNKATFWSGVIKDSVLGGTITNCYDILYEFCYNPYFIGTIAGSENIFKVHFRVHCDECENNKFKTVEDCDKSNFLTIDLNNMMNDNSEGTSKIVEAGNVFPNLKKELEKKLVFLPGGDVGKNSLYTIFENTLRNVKHCDRTVDGKIQIEFNIHIIEQKIGEDGEEKFYDVEVWVGNKQDLWQTNTIFLDKNEQEGQFSDDKLGKIEEDNIDKVWVLDNGKYKEIDLGSYHLSKNTETIEIDNYNTYNKMKVRYYSKKTKDILTTKTKKSIIDENSKPRMGGTYQDKICASQLFTNDFDNVDKEYMLNGGKLDFVRDSNKNEDNKRGNLVTTIRIWKGDNYNKEPIDIDIDGENGNGLFIDKNKNIIENLRRFKLFVSNDSGQKKYLESLGVVRVVEKDKKNQNLNGYDKKFKNYYDKWLDEWLGDYKISIGGEGNIGWRSCVEGNKWLLTEVNLGESNNNGYHLVTFTHNDNDENLSIKNQGIAGKEFFEISVDGNINGIKANNIQQKEIIEVIGSKIIAIDNRVNNYISDTGKTDNLWNGLFLKTFSEGKDKTEANEILTKVINIGKTDSIHFLILHLTFIEQIWEGNIVDFINEKLTSNGNYIFKKLVITTGRGRSGWYSYIKENSDLKSKILFLPPESITSALSYGIMISDDFEIKYRLIKLLMN